MSFAIEAPLFYAVEIEVYQPGVGSLAFDHGHGSHPHGALSLHPLPAETPGMIRASDMGYHTRQGDAGGLQLYPPVLDTAFEIDRRVGLAPGDASTRTFGSIRLDNLNGRYDDYAETRNSDNRLARILVGQKGYDPGRGIATDPPYAALQPLFAGSALPWQLDELQLTIPLADPAAWLDRPVQRFAYAGTGGLEGGPELTGKPKPMTRGGTPSQPVLEVPLIAVDPVSLVYQWTDGHGTVVNLYEGGKAVFVYDGDGADIYASAPAAGHYRTCNAKGVLRLGSKPVATLSADVTGSYPATAATTPAAMALAMMTEDMGLDDARIDTGSFAAAAAIRPWVAGYYLGTDQAQGKAQVEFVLAAINGRLISTRSGLLSCFLLAPLSPGVAPVIALTPENVVSVTPQALPSSVDPPPFRVLAGYAKYWQTQGTGTNATISATRAAQLKVASRYATAASSTVLANYRRPNDPAPIDTILLAQSDAFVLASIQLGLFKDRPGYHAVEVPIAVGSGLDIGDVVLLLWPLGGLRNGQVGQIVGEQIRSADNTITFPVLISPGVVPGAIGRYAELGRFEFGVHELAPGG